MFVIANMDITHEKMLILVKALYFGGFCLSFLCVFDFFGNGIVSQLLGVKLVTNWYGDYVFLGFEENPNGLASQLLPVVIISYALFLSNQNKQQQYLHLVACLIAGYALTMTYSRSGFLGAIAGILITLFFYINLSKSGRVKPVLLALGLVGMFVFSGLGLTPYLSSFFDNTFSLVSELSVRKNKIESVSIRLETLPHFLKIAWDNMYFGVGFGQSSALVGLATGHFVGPHNIFLGVLVEYGFAAFLALFALIIWPCARGFMYIMTRGRIDDMPVAPIIVYSCFISLLLHGMFHKMYVNFGLWLFVACSCRFTPVRQDTRSLSIHEI